MENSLKNKLKYDYERATEMPSSQLWDQIEAKLNAKEKIVISPKKSRKINYWKYAAVILGLISLSVLFKYSLQDKATNETPTLTKVETPVKNEIQINDSTNEVQKTEIQATQNQDFVQQEKLNSNSQNFARKSQTIEKFTDNSKKLNKTGKDKILSSKNTLETKNIDKPIIQKEEMQFVENSPIDVPLKKNAIQYVKADELLFGRALKKEKNQIANIEHSKESFGKTLVNKIKPSSITVFGIIVYSEEESN